MQALRYIFHEFRQENDEISDTHEEKLFIKYNINYLCLSAEKCFQNNIKTVRCFIMFRF